VIISTLMYTDNHQPALDCCAAIISSTKESPSGIDVIFTALRRLHPPGSDATTAACPLLQWMKMNEDSLVKQMGRSKPAPWMANELAEIFHTNDMHGLADHWYLRASYLDFQRLYEIHQRSGLKPDEAYLDQFLADDVKPSLKHVMDLLMYSLSVENVLKGAKNLKFKQLPWVTKSLVGAFSTFETMGITPLSPSECEPLISSLSEHLKSGESMEALMTKHIQPYIALSNSFKTKMFGIDLGL
jgi:hypothetical protein